MEEERKKDGGLGLRPEKVLKTTPSRTSENALLEHRVNVAVISNLPSQKENLLEMVQPSGTSVSVQRLPLSDLSFTQAIYCFVFLFFS